MSARSRRWEIFQDIVMWAAPVISMLLIHQIVMHLQDPDNRHSADKATAAAARQRIQSIFSSKKNEEGDDDDNSDDDDDDAEYRYGHDRPKVADLNLSTYEQTIAMELVAPKDIAVSFKDIGGLDDIIEELKESVIYPLTMAHLYSQASSLLSAPSGVLLFGPPGCGKTMLAKALAHESGACFINLHISTLTEKWYGDSNKLVKAVFSLARKLQPTIVFIDEIDAVLGTRRTGEHEASGMVKAEFMTHWDGLVSANSTGQPQRICILGATNRIQDIDDAILRRMPKKFAVPLPSASQRRGIFNLVLKGTKVDRAHFDLDLLVKLSSGLSGSDIKEACRDAAMIPMREVIRRKNAEGAPLRRQVDAHEIRGVTTDDFFRRQFDARDTVPLDDEDEAVDRKDEPVAREVTRGAGEDEGEDPAWTDEDSSDEERRRKKGKKDRR